MCASGNKLPSAVGNYARRYFCSNGRLPAHHLAGAAAGPSHLACLHSRILQRVHAAAYLLYTRADDRSLSLSLAAAGISGRPARKLLSNCRLFALDLCWRRKFWLYAILAEFMSFFVPSRIINSAAIVLLCFDNLACVRHLWIRSWSVLHVIKLYHFGELRCSCRVFVCDRAAFKATQQLPSVSFTQFGRKRSVLLWIYETKGVQYL